MPASAARAWVRTGLDNTSKSEHQLWEDARAKASREIPIDSPERSVLTLSCSPINTDAIFAAIERSRLKKAVTSLPADSDSLYRNALVDELAAMRKEAHEVVPKVRELQNHKLEFWAKDLVLAEMGLLKADLYTSMPVVENFSWDIWTPTVQLSKLRDQWRPLLDLARKIASDFDAIRTFMNLDPGDKALALWRVALSRTLPEIADRQERIEARQLALEARLTPPKRKKSKRAARSQPQPRKAA